MKCPYCGAEVNTKVMKCEYCGSQIEKKSRKERRREKREATNSKRSKFVKILIAMAIIFMLPWLLMIAIAGVCVFVNYDDIAAEQAASESSYEEERLVSKFPKNGVDLKGDIVSCTTKGVATIRYMDELHYDVKIMDSELIEWLVDRGSSLDNIMAMFSTDEDRNISEISLGSDPFYIICQEGDSYVALRKDHIIVFTSEMELEVDKCYEGYFHYPDMELHNGWTSDCGTMDLWLFDLHCDEKMVTKEKPYYGGDEVTVYKIRVESTWYYCSEATYNRINVGDDIDNYNVVGNDYRYIY